MNYKSYDPDRVDEIKHQIRLDALKLKQDREKESMQRWREEAFKDQKRIVGRHKY